MGTTRKTMMPKAVSDVLLAYPADVSALLPPATDIPEQYWHHDESWSCALFTDMFFEGVRGLAMVPREGVDPAVAFRHILAIMRSYQPKHEHKEAGCRYLLDLWFMEAKWETGTCAPETKSGSMTTD